MGIEYVGVGEEEIEAWDLWGGYGEAFGGMEEGSIVLKPSKTFNFRKQGIQVEGERQSIDSDLVIFATGFKGDQKLSNIFVPSKFEWIVAGVKDNVVPLYRDKSEVAITLPSWKVQAACKRSMEKNVMEWEKHVKKYSGTKYRGSCISTLHIWNNDQLCKDMG
ncbi:hypothetical protein IEQ34_014380 [Dendrobium chrysotoxum]|uniref:Flavin-containing monooxygenase n=1 Tax=Dendrobium chrysotoxum TaxID=161865 RepID=A0AAV7GLI4_DENCH|nr:hypothetical protein IEQ34_014380 [Dendrobium chrysotoxum]